MEKINNVVKSPIAPKTTNAIWINTEDNTINVFDEYQGWIQVSGSGGGNSNLMIGTEEERLAFENPVEGMEWNEIDIDPEGNKYITKYVYFNGEWVAELSTYEMVEVRIKLFDKENNDVTDDDEELIGKKVHVTLEHGDVIEAEIDDRHIAVLEIEHGTEYTVSLEGITHNYYVTKVDKLTHVASEPVRIINVEMHAALAPGFYGITEDGKAYDADEIEAMLDAAQSEDEKTEIRNSFKYIGVNTSNLSAANCGFMYALTGEARFNNSQSKQWAISNVEFDQNQLPYKQNDAFAALDLDGKTNTDKIISIGDDISVDTPAADWCRKEYYKITINGVEKYGFLPAYGQLRMLSNTYYSENVTALIRLHALIFNNPSATVPFSSGGWWSSTQYNAGYAVNLGNGSFNNSSGKALNGTTLVCWAL